jgi:hypothetical protein
MRAATTKMAMAAITSRAMGLSVSIIAVYR